MPANGSNGARDKKRTSAATNLIAGGGAGMMEALVCHPLDTIKVRMQLSKRNRGRGVPPRGFVETGRQIYQREGFFALYKGLGAVMTGIVPKMAIRFSSYEQYKELLANQNGEVSSTGRFFAGLAAGVTEAVCVVTPMEVVKIRLQAQYHSMSDPLDVPKYRNAAQGAWMILREEGPSALYRGVSLTALRQGTNQAVNFMVYGKLKEILLAHQPQYQKETGAELPFHQTSLIGLISGACGPLTNAPIDTIKTRLQRGAKQEEPVYPSQTQSSPPQPTRPSPPSPPLPGSSSSSLQNPTQPQSRSQPQPQLRSQPSPTAQSHSPPRPQPTPQQPTLHQSPLLPKTSSWTRITDIMKEMWKQEGFKAFYKGITPRIIRVAPGQAVTFAVYEKLKGWMESPRWSTSAGEDDDGEGGNKYEE